MKKVFFLHLFATNCEFFLNLFLSSKKKHLNGMFFYFVNIYICTFLRQCRTCLQYKHDLFFLLIKTVGRCMTQSVMYVSFRRVGMYDCIARLSALWYTVRKFNWWRFCYKSALCDEIFDTLFDLTLRHIDLCNSVISHIQRNPPKPFLQCALWHLRRWNNLRWW